VNYNKRKV